MDPTAHNPFGYTFADFPGPDDDAHPLLDENENRTLELSFKNTDPNADPYMLPPHLDTKDGANEFDWPVDPPATIHSVSTTIPDQAQYQHGYQGDQIYASDSFSGVHLNPSYQDLQAASTLFRNAHLPQYNGTPYGSQSGPSSGRQPSALDSSDFGHIPRVPTSQGHLDEQLAALLPRHSTSGTVDASIAAQFSQVQDQHVAQVAQIHGHRPSLKRQFTFGTDNAFNRSGYIPASPHDTDAAVTQRLMNTVLHAAQPTTKDAASTAENTRPSTPVDNRLLLPIGRRHIESDDDAHSENMTDEEDSGGGNGEPVKKRRKSKHVSPTRVKTEKVKGAAGSRPGKGRKASVDDDSAKKRRSSVQAQKIHRENLTEEQKRNNHILSEQKRRNLIKKGFSDLHELVPELRNGSLSKSSVLTEAANFLEKLVTENQKYSQILSSSGG